MFKTFSLKSIINNYFNLKQQEAPVSEETVSDARPFVYVFLDFDGVLHPGTRGNFEHIGLFLNFINVAKKIGLIPKIVISSNWKTSNSEYELKETLLAYAGIPLSSIDLYEELFATPFVTEDLSINDRSKEINSYIETNKLISCNPHCSIIVIDDDRLLFSKTKLHPNAMLHLCDNRTGLSVADVRNLLGYIEQKMVSQNKQ